MVTGYLGLLAAVGLQRCGELWLSRRNARWALAHGGIELGAGLNPWMKLMHGAFLLSCAAEVLLLGRRFHPHLGIPMLTFVALSQGLRCWTMRALGHLWNTRVIVVAGADVITRGPYRFLRHPNYLAVTVEMIALPLVQGAWITAVIFSLLNAALLSVRIPCEEHGLATYCRGTEALTARPRLWPFSSWGATR